ncbi:MAG: hypothetical protein JEY94_08875 [Melioribacteraceae bacterium]|nr:hypothetical protein [Melioribacteraceae bacterium]
MLISFIEGFRISLRSKKMITIIYLSILIFGLLAAIPFFGSAKTNFANSLLINDLLKDFDYRAYSDLTHNFKEAIAPFISIIQWFGVGYLFFSLFLSAGILGTFIKNENEYQLKTFLRFSGKYFGRFAKLFLYTFILQLISFAVLTIPFALIITSLVDTVQSESTLVYISLVYIQIFVAVFYLFSLLADYTKIILVKENSNQVLKSMWSSVKFIYRNLKSILLYILTFWFPVSIMLLYLLIEDVIGMTSGFTIVLMIIFQQVFVWFRVLGKVWILASEVSFYDRKSITLLTEKEDEELDEFEDTVTETV